MIEKAILKLVWIIFIQGPLALINAFNKVLEYLTGGVVNDILFGSKKEFDWNNIPIQFWWFVIISFCIFALVFTIQMIILTFQEAAETKTKFVLALQNGVKAFGFMFLIPIFFFLANFIVQNLANAVINHFGTNSTIAQYLYHIGDTNWDAGDLEVPGDFGPPSNIKNYNIIAQLFGTWFMLFAVFIIGITLVQKVIELFFLFIISPIVMIVMVVDDGKAAFGWKDMVVAKFLASTGTLIGFYIFISVTQILLSSGLGGLTGIARSLFIILFLCGGGLATMAFSDMIANFIGESAGIKEGMASMRSTMAGGMMAMGAAKMTGRALGFMKSKRAQRNSSILNSGNSLAGTDSGTDENSSHNANAGVSATTFRNAATGMAARSGIIGLTGIGLGILGVGVGHIAAGTKKSWKAGNRKNVWGKTKGVARVVSKASVAPVAVTTKVLGRSIDGIKNTFNVTKNSAAVVKAKSLNQHKASLSNKKDSYGKKIVKTEAIIKMKSEPSDNYLKKMNKKLEKYQRKHDKWKNKESKYDGN